MFAEKRKTKVRKKVVKFTLEDDGQLKTDFGYEEISEEPEEPELANDSKNKLTLVLGFIDDSGKILSTRKSCSTWTIVKEGLKLYDNDTIRQEMSEIFKHQLKLDLDKKDIIRQLVDDIFESDWAKNI